MATGIRSLFEGNIRLDAFPTNLTVTDDAISLDQLTDGGQRVSKAIMRNGYRLSPTGSDTIDEPGLEDTGNTGAYGSSNYEVSLPLFRYFDGSGMSDEEQDVAYTLFSGKGVQLWLAERIGPPAAQDYAAGDIVDIYPVILDDPQRPTDLTGYQKVVQPARVTGAVHLRVEVVGNGN